MNGDTPGSFDHGLPAVPPGPVTPLGQTPQAPAYPVQPAVSLDLNSLRAQKARLGRRIGKGGYQALVAGAALSLVFGVLLYYADFDRLAYLSGAVALLCFMWAAWYKQDLSVLAPTKNAGSLTDAVHRDVLARLKPGQILTPRSLWQALRSHWQVIFFTNHFLLDSRMVEDLLSNHEADMALVWQEAERLARDTECAAIEPGHIAGALLLTSPDIREFLIRMKISTADVEAMTRWLGRVLETLQADKPYFGGIGRDWANGFTPRLNQYGYNLSLDIERHGAHFGWLTQSPGVTAIKNAFSQGASTVALIGDVGVGKTSHVNALAQLLLEEKNDRNLEHRQIVSLNPSAILSAARHPGELEQIVVSLLVETAHAGHIILFLDDAQLFLRNGHGSFDVTQILLPVLQSRSVQLIMALTPHDYQTLRADNAAFANLLTPVMLQEPPEGDVLRVLEDHALSLEHGHKVLISYEALTEAYRLSGRYLQDAAFPGKAIQLLEQSLSYAEQGGIVTPVSVQRAIEQSQGVKVGSAAPAEADALLNLEDKIHERMINQVQAVSVVAAALRRARAGVANPRRPIGSFLFLGPTGVGKTELAKAVAATYFNAESSMIRLDMSEYQQPEDVQRLLSSGANESSSLIMAVRRQPFAVVLLDEIEKAHPNILNLLLQLLDEGQLTDNGGRVVSFKDCVIIATSNAGANLIRERIGQGQQPAQFQNELTDELIRSGQYKPELLNRFDEIVIFRPLRPEELAQVVGLMMADINKTLGAQNISVELTPAAVMKVVETGYDPRLGARPMRRALQRAVEDGIAGRILRGETRPGDHVVLDVTDLAG
ncbi:MAG TPA: AAA family ATPase [Candidatus Saccharimonadales bacterium]|nr:AAA family ATPase [Candidatus Saccharimonadales bacterium]